MTNSQLVSIIILTYNGQKYFQPCFQSALNQTYPFKEIIIIDNASKDQTPEQLRKIKEPKVKIIFNQENRGFSAGQNQGISQSQGDFVLCLNQDVVLEKNFIQSALKLLKEDEQIGAIQGKLLRQPINQQEPIIDTTGLVILKNRRIINRGQGQKDRGEYNQVEEVFGPDGASPLYRRSALESVKINHEYFDEDFNMYKEDVDLAWRLRLRGWRTFYQPEAVGWHWRGSGDSLARSPWRIIRERKKINQLAKYLAFKNQRLAQIKNELPSLFFKHLPWIIPKEIAAWLYVLCWEKNTWPAIRELFKQMPSAWQKRKMIMAQKKVSSQAIEQWFD